MVRLPRFRFRDRLSSFRLPRLSLARSLLLVALFAFLFSLGVECWRKHGTGVTSNHPVLATSPDGTTLATNCSFRPLFQRQHPVVLSSTATPEKYRTLESHRWIVTDVAWSPDGQRVFSVGDSSFRVWDVAAGEEIQKIEFEGFRPASLTVSPDERLAAMGGNTGNPIVRVLNLETGDVVADLKGIKRWAWAAEFSPDGSSLVAAGLDGEVLVWDTESWSLRASFRTSGNSRDIDFSPSGQLLVIGSKAPQNGARHIPRVEVRDIHSGEIMDDYPIEITWAAISSFAISPDGSRLVAAHGGKEEMGRAAVSIWDFDTKQLLKTIEVGELGDAWIEALEFSADGETLFMANDSARVISLDVETERTSLVFRRPSLPWMYAVVGSCVWLMAWRIAPRPKQRTVDA